MTGISTTGALKSITGVYTNTRGHWVGDGFPVRTLFDYNTFGQPLSPFLMLDYAGPHEFTPTTKRRGVGTHPHRGFETVTIVYAGEVSHRDSSGGGGTIGPGDVQWMTAGAGVVHEEFHSVEFGAKGGVMEMVQLWVNLPAKDKMTPGKYQAITDAQIPSVALPDDAGLVRVIAGAFGSTRGPASTFSPMDVWDVRLGAGKRSVFSVPSGRSLAVVVLRGDVKVNDDPVVKQAQFALLSQDGSEVVLAAGDEDAKLLILSGEPLNEPIAGYGPFVMNTEQEIHKAIEDYNSGKFGKMTARRE